jgi:hypothetical protein
VLVQHVPRSRLEDVTLPELGHVTAVPRLERLVTVVGVRTELALDNRYGKSLLGQTDGGSEPGDASTDDDHAFSHRAPHPPARRT